MTFSWEYQGKVYELMEAKIIEVNDVGLIRVKFKQPYKERKSNLITEAVLNVTLLTLEENEYKQFLNFTWSCVEFTETGMLI